MPIPSSIREVHLVDAQLPGRPLTRARVVRVCPAAYLDDLESQWTQARERAVSEGLAERLVPFEHSHWDWRNKLDSVEAEHHLLVAVECQDLVQGIIAVLRTARRSPCTGESVVYVDHLESAPWNLRDPLTPPRFLGVGTVLIAEAIHISLEID
jgi:hypothetical protein